MKYYWCVPPTAQQHINSRIQSKWKQTKNKLRIKIKIARKSSEEVIENISLYCSLNCANLYQIVFEKDSLLDLIQFMSVKSPNKNKEYEAMNLTSLS